MSGGAGVSRLVFAPLTPAAFAPFGRVIAAQGGPATTVNQGRGLRHDIACELEGPGRINLAVYALAPSPLPLAVTLFERHPVSQQVFVPMACSRYGVVVAPAGRDGLPDLSRAAAFMAAAGQGVLYARDVWHHPLAAFDTPASFAMMIREDGSERDCVIHALRAPLLCGEPERTQPEPAHAARS